MWLINSLTPVNALLAENCLLLITSLNLSWFCRQASALTTLSQNLISNLVSLSMACLSFLDIQMLCLAAPFWWELQVTITLCLMPLDSLYLWRSDFNLAMLLIQVARISCLAQCLTCFFQPYNLTTTLSLNFAGIDYTFCDTLSMIQQKQILPQIVLGSGPQTLSKIRARIDSFYRLSSLVI